MEAKSDSKTENAQYFLKWIERNGEKKFNKRDAHQGCKGRFKTVDDIEPPLKLLTDRYYIRPIPDTKPKAPGRPPSPEYEVNPELFEPEKTQFENHQNPSHNSHNSVTEGENGNCENCENTFEGIENEKTSDGWGDV